jgi:hypothetical protein
MRSGGSCPTSDREADSRPLEVRSRGGQDWSAITISQRPTPASAAQPIVDAEVDAEGDALVRVARRRRHAEVWRSPRCADRMAVPKC